MESVEEFNPEARDAQSAELDRIRRLELHGTASAKDGVKVEEETGIVAPEETGEAGGGGGGGGRTKSSSSPEVIRVERQPSKLATSKAPPVDAIVIDSGSSDSDAGHQRPPVSQAPVGGSHGSGPSHAPRKTDQAPRRRLYGKYDLFRPRPDGRVLVNEGHGRGEEDVFLAPQVARIAKPHQV
jgi:hypothetical protein